MRTSLVAALASALAITSFAARAEPVEVRGQLELGVARNFTLKDNTKRINASVAFGLWGDWGAQFDVGVGKYINTYSTAPTAALHLTYDISPELTLGAFAAGDDTRPGNWFYYGLEGRYDNGKILAEAYVAEIDEVKGGRDGERFGLDARLGLGGSLEAISVLAGAHGQDLPGDKRGYGYLGARYDFANDMAVSMTVGRTDNSDTVAGMALTIPFGGGARMGTRDSRSLFLAY